MALQQRRTPKHPSPLRNLPRVRHDGFLNKICSGRVYISEGSFQYGEKDTEILEAEHRRWSFFEDELVGGIPLWAEFRSRLRCLSGLKLRGNYARLIGTALLEILGALWIPIWVHTE
jgi:hypothetical protein